MEKLLGQIERAGYHLNGEELRDAPEWLELKARVANMKAWAVEAKKAIDLLTAPDPEQPLTARYVTGAKL